jgi:hypothetical protein
MNWIHFFFWLTGIYSLYYLAVILLDRGARPPAKAAGAELTFSETNLPQQVEHLPAQLPVQKRAEPATTGSGGVNLKSLFGLAREEAILYTRAVSF